MYISGRPSSPTLTVVAVTYQAATFTISPPSYAGQCVLNYTIAATSSSDGSVLPDITVEVTDTEAPTIATRSGFECNNTYTFTVVANTLNFTGEAGFFGPYHHNPNISK